MNNKMGSVPLSADIRDNAKIGLWAIELDDNKEPRMYGDEIMLGLLGIDNSASPEQIYHAWYDYVDDGYYDVVNACVAKMCEGKFDEVQYPWHHPNGRTIIIRCGGKRNYAYENGIRLEGSHRDITGLGNFEELLSYKKYYETAEVYKEFVSLLMTKHVSAYYVNLADCSQIVYKREGELDRKYGHINNYFESINLYIDQDVDPEDKALMRKVVKPDYIRKRAEREGSFQILYRDISSGSPRTYSFEVIPSDNPDLVVFCFSDLEDTIQQQLRYERLEEQSKRTGELIGHFIKNADVTYSFDIKNEILIPIKLSEEDAELFGINGMTKYTDVVKSYIEKAVYGPDKKLMYEVMTAEYLRDHLEEDSFEVNFRESLTGKPIWYTFKVGKLSEDRVLISLFNMNDEITGEIVDNTLFGDLIAAYYANLEEDIITVVKPSAVFPEDQFAEENGFTKSMVAAASIVAEEYRDKWFSFTKLENLKRELTKQSRVEFVYLSTAGSMKRFVKATFYVVERKADETPLTIVLVYSSVDKQQIEIIQLNKALAEALSMAQSANRAKTTFLNNMSHDIRTPMNAILGFANLATKNIDSKAQVRDYLSKIGQSSEHLMQLINDVLDMSRIESGTVEISEKDESLPQIIKGVRNMILPEVNEKQMNFKVDMGELKNDRIVCDRLRLNQVLINVLSNAVKYTPPLGNITFTIIEKNASRKGYAAYEFRIKDNGSGMSEEYLKTIFEPFTRAKSSTVSGIEGTGLGMAITKSLVDMMDGTIEINSREGEGTEVILNFEFKRHYGEHIVVEEKPATKNDALEGKRLLLVEDNELNRQIAIELLEAEGIIVDTVDDGVYAVDMMKFAQEGAYDAILMDVQMPIMDGYEATRNIRALKNGIGEKIPIIAMTANAFEEDRQLALKAGMNDHIAKPIEVKKLLEVLSKLL